MIAPMSWPGLGTRASPCTSPQALWAPPRAYLPLQTCAPPRPPSLCCVCLLILSTCAELSKVRTTFTSVVLRPGAEVGDLRRKQGQGFFFFTSAVQVKSLRLERSQGLQKSQWWRQLRSQLCARVRAVAAPLPPCHMASERCPC